MSPASSATHVAGGSACWVWRGASQALTSEVLPKPAGAETRVSLLLSSAPGATVPTNADAVPDRDGPVGCAVWLSGVGATVDWGVPSAYIGVKVIFLGMSTACPLSLCARQRLSAKFLQPVQRCSCDTRLSALQGTAGACFTPHGITQTSHPAWPDVSDSL